MSSKIKVYKGDPTAGETDGTLVSTDTWNEPIESGDIEVPEEGHTEGGWIKCAVRCDPTFETREKDDKHVTLSIETVPEAADNRDKWQLSLTNAPGDPNWGEDLVLTSQVLAVNVIFYIRARAAAGEDPDNDQSCQVHAAALIGKT